MSLFVSTVEYIFNYVNIWTVSTDLLARIKYIPSFNGKSHHSFMSFHGSTSGVPRHRRNIRSHHWLVVLQPEKSSVIGMTTNPSQQKYIKIIGPKIELVIDFVGNCFGGIKHIQLVGGIPTHLKNMKINWNDEIPNIWENKPVMFQSPPTRNMLSCSSQHQASG